MKYKTSHKQFDKYFIFIEQAIKKTKGNGLVCYIVPNKFFKIGAGEKLRSLIAKERMLVSLDDFGDAQLFEVSVPITKHAEIFNGIQTSAERPTPIYWFSSDEIVVEYADTIEISRNGNNYTIEKAMLRPYFKPTKKAEKGLNSYSILATDKQIIFPYDSNGHLIR